MRRMHASVMVLVDYSLRAAFNTAVAYTAVALLFGSVPWMALPFVALLALAFAMEAK